MKSFFLFVAGVVTFLNSNLLYGAKAYDYPYADPWKATLSAAFTRPDVIDVNIDRVVLIPERNNVPFIGEKNSVAFSYYYSEKKDAPLVFIIPGTGASGVNTYGSFIAEKLYNQGFSVINLPSPTNWQFALGGSRIGASGFSPADAQDYYEFMKAVYKKASATISPRKISLLGASLGAVDAVYVTLLDLKLKQLNLSGLALIDPPLDLESSQKLLDNSYFKQLTKNQVNDSAFKQRLLDFAYGFLGDVFFDNATPELQKKYQMKADKLTTEQVKWLIAFNYHEVAKELVFISQSIHDDGVMKTSFTELNLSARRRESDQLSFADYTSKILIPRLVKNKLLSDKSHFFSDYQWFPEMGKINKSIKTMIFHNEDDIFLTDTDRMSLKKYKGPAKIYPHGGHLGNVWYQDNIHDIEEFFNSLK